jgi:protein-disulfide isomerase
MKQVSWVIALVIGFAIGFIGRGALDGAPGSGRVPPAPTVQARSRPVEDPRAVYRVPVEDSPARGPADALVTIVEFSDFQCPYCKRGYSTLKQVEELYAGKVRVVFKQNPLPMHPMALPAALATEEARAQGGDARFFALHDKLFDSAPALDAPTIERLAGEAGLDVAKVRAAMDDQRSKDRIQRDQRLAASLGANGTPAFFINGRKLSGAQQLERFKAVIDEELQKAEALVRQGTPADGVYARIMASGATAPVLLPTVPAGTGPVRAEAPAAAAPPAPTAPAAPAAPPPAEYRKVPVRADDPARGPADAKVTVVLFSDFQCPYCSRVEPTLKQLEDAFPGQLRIVWKHQPLPFHQNAMPAAVAAEAAREQGKFWPMHDRLFANQQALSAEQLAQSAEAIGLDMGRYRAAIAGARGPARIAEDQALASQIGVNGTPTMFFNCRQVVGALPLDRMRPVVEEELKKADEKLKGGRPGAGFYEKICEANVASAPPAPLPGAPVQGLTVRPDDPAKGSPSAPVTLVVFSDFQCPYCSRLTPTLAEVEKAYGPKVRIVWKNQPLPFHANAMPAALAAEAARQQGKFWPMHDRLFANQQLLSDAQYAQYARELGLDLARFDAARRSPQAQARIAEDQALAGKVGAGGTPTMFVNGVKVEGAVPFASLKTVIDQQLAKK